MVLLNAFGHCIPLCMAILTLFLKDIFRMKITDCAKSCTLTMDQFLWVRNPDTGLSFAPKRSLSQAYLQEVSKIQDLIGSSIEGDML